VLRDPVKSSTKAKSIRGKGVRKAPGLMKLVSVLEDDHSTMSKEGRVKLGRGNAGKRSHSRERKRIQR